MPELPEVETIRLGLIKRILGQKIVRVQVLEKKAFIGSVKNILNQEIINVERRGKLLRIFLDHDLELQVHFKLNGQILYQEEDLFKKNKYTRVILFLEDGSRIIFNDMRKFGWMKVAKRDLFKDSDYGIEPLTKYFTVKNLRKVVISSTKPIKTLLMDQKKIAGIGNIYACESLFQARINPFKIAKKLTTNEIDSLYKSITNILQCAIVKKGSSMRDEMYRQVTGELGEYQTQFLVYEKEGEKCFRCGSSIKRLKQGGRSTYCCKECQK